MNYIRAFEIMASVFFLLYLLWATMQDAKEMCVARYTHLLGVVAIILIMIVRGIFRIEGISHENALWIKNLWEIGSACAIQWLGHKMQGYALADVFVLNICTIFHFFEGGSYRCLLFYFAFYALSIVLLFAAQLINGNLKGVNLKKKVPFIPYLSVAFFLTKWVI